jgi:hypothetical protein
MVTPDAGQERPLPADGVADAPAEQSSLLNVSHA